MSIVACSGCRLIMTLRHWLSDTSYMEAEKHILCHLEKRQSVALGNETFFVVHELEADPYDLDAPLVSFMVGLGSFKSRQKAMMDVDCVISMPGTKV